MIFDFISLWMEPQRKSDYSYTWLCAITTAAATAVVVNDNDESNSMQINYYKIDLLAQTMSNFAILFG